MLKSIAHKLRKRSRYQRYQMISTLMQLDMIDGPILDLGGGPASFFAGLFPKPQQVILLENDITSARNAQRKFPEMQVLLADGQHMPLASNSVALIVCNSVIEHVLDPFALAQEIQRVADTYFVQTPNGNFPFETHSFIPIPFYHMLSRPVRKWLCDRLGASFDYISSVTYIPEADLSRLFSSATIQHEQFLGVDKSYYVFHRSQTIS